MQCTLNRLLRTLLSGWLCYMCVPHQEGGHICPARCRCRSNGIKPRSVRAKGHGICRSWLLLQATSLKLLPPPACRHTSLPSCRQHALARTIDAKHNKSH
jgi:hypothetical protein